MKFNSDHKVVISSLSLAELSVFITFLRREVWRHRVEFLCYKVMSRLSVYPMNMFYGSAAIRHDVDIRETTQLIKELKGPKD